MKAILKKYNENIVFAVGRKILDVLTSEYRSLDSENQIDFDFELTLESISSISQDQEVSINISLSNLNITGMFNKNTDGRVIYYIDIYCVNENDSSSLDLLRQNYSICSEIISNPNYSDLQFPKGIVQQFRIDDADFQPMDIKNESNGLRICRLTCSCKVNDITVQGAEALPLMENWTNGYICSTDKGYKYIRKGLYNLK